MKIIAFDLGANFAMAHNGFPEVVCVEYGVFTGPRAHRAGKTLHYITRRLKECKDNEVPMDVAVYERPFARGMDATRCLWGLAGIIEAACTYAGLAVVDVTPSEIKKWSTGNAKASKEQMLDAAHAMGYLGFNEHEADAYCLLKYAEANTILAPTKGKK